MDQFEKQFEDLDVQATYVEGAMNQSTTLSTPQDQVDMLISQVADEYDLKLVGELGSIPAAQNTTAMADQDELTDRLNRLKAKS